MILDAVSPKLVIIAVVLCGELVEFSLLGVTVVLKSSSDWLLGILLSFEVTEKFPDGCLTFVEFLSESDAI